MAIPFSNWTYDSRLPHRETSLRSCEKAIARHYDMQYITDSVFRFIGSDKPKHTLNAANITVFSAFPNRHRLSNRHWGGNAGRRIAIMVFGAFGRSGWSGPLMYAAKLCEAGSV